MAKPDETEEPKTLGAQYAGLPGEPLEEVEDEDVVITAIEITTRNFRGDPEAKFALITLEGNPPMVVHTWSASLIDKLSMIPQEALPGRTRFHKVPTSAGRKVWTLD